MLDQRRARHEVRPLPRSRDVPDPRPARPHDRVRRPGAESTEDSRRNTSTRPRPRCSTRAASCSACGRCARRNRSSPRLIVVEGYMDVIALHQSGVHAGGGDARHRDHARPRRDAVPPVRRRVLLLRRRPRRAPGRVARAGIGAAAHARRPPGVVPVPARRRGSGFAGAQGRPGRFRAAPEGRDAAQRILLRRTRQGREPRQPRRQGAPGRTRAAAARADSRRRVPRSDARANSTG